MMKDNGNYFEDLNNLFTKAYEEENIVVDEEAKHRIRENLAYKIEKIKLQGWESPLSLFLKDKLRFAPVILPLLLIGVFTTFAAVGYIDIPFIGGEKESTESNDTQEIAMSTVRDTDTPERDEGQLIMADILQDELEEDVVEIEEAVEKTSPVLPRNLSQEEPPELLVLDINTMGEAQYVFEPQAPSQPPVVSEPQKEDDKSMLAFGESIKTGGGIDLSLFGIDEESASSIFVEEETVVDEQDSNKTVDDTPADTSESTNDLGDESDLADDTTQDQADDQKDVQDTQDQSPPADTTDDSGSEDSTDDSKPDDDDKVETYMVAYLIPQGKELEALNFSNTEIEKLVSNKDVDKVTIEYLEDTKIKVTIENEGRFEYYTFVKDGFAWKEFDLNSVLQNNLNNTLLLEPTIQPMTLNPALQETTLTNTFKTEITKYNFFK